MHSVCVVSELHFTVNYIKILTVPQQCCYGKFMSLDNADYTYQFL